jgi:hypothetical protein
MDGSTSAYVGACRKDIPYPSVSHESVPSLIDNLVAALYGQITKTVVNRRVQWYIPCDPNNTATINNIPRNAGEGLLCYIIRALNLTGGSGIVTIDGTQTLTNKTLTAPIINGGTINNLTAIGTLALPAGSITTSMIANGTILPIDLSTGGPYWDTSGNLGIGTSSPTAKVHTYQDSTGAVISAVENPNTGVSAAAMTRLVSNGKTASFSVNGAGGYAGLAGQASNITTLYTDFDAVAFRKLDGTTKLLLNSDNNVGIGTSSPSYKLDIQGAGSGVKVTYNSSTNNVGAAGYIYQGVSNNLNLANGQYQNSSGTTLATNATGSNISVGSDGSISFGNFQGATVGSTPTNIQLLKINTDGTINSQGNPIYNCKTTAKAWVNFNGTGTTGAAQTIRSSYNVSSVTKNATGDYTINFANSMTDTNYVAIGTTTGAAGTSYQGVFAINARSLNTCRGTINLINAGNSNITYDSAQIDLVIFGN